MSAQEIAKIEETLRQMEDQRTEVKALHDQLTIECNTLRYAIDVLKRSK